MVQVWLSCFVILKSVADKLSDRKTKRTSNTIENFLYCIKNVLLFMYASVFWEKSYNFRHYYILWITSIQIINSLLVMFFVADFLGFEKVRPEGVFWENDWFSECTAMRNMGRMILKYDIGAIPILQEPSPIPAPSGAGGRYSPGCSPIGMRSDPN